MVVFINFTDYLIIILHWTIKGQRIVLIRFDYDMRLAEFQH